MKLLGLMALTLIALAVSSIAASAQSDREFQDKAGGFSVSLAGDWRAVTYNDAVGRQKTDFIYRDRSEGLLRVNKDALGGRQIDQVAREEEESLRISKEAFEQGGREPFGGGPLRGIRLAFNYVDGGRKMAATYYFLQDGNDMWVLRFTGKRGVLDRVRNLTDQIARSFHPAR
jgi:hypothetical protein